MAQLHLYVPSDKVLGLRSQLLICWEVQVPRPVYDFAVCVVRLLCAEGWPTDQALKHNCANTPPVTSKVVSLATENLGRNVIGRADGGVCKLSPRLTPRVDLCAVGDCELNLIKGNAIAILCKRFGLRLRHQLLVVRCRVLLGKSGRKTEISQLNVPAAIQKDVVRFDVTWEMSAAGCAPCCFALTDG